MSITSSSCSLLAALLVSSSVVHAGEAELATAEAWFECQDVGADAGRGLRGMIRASAVHSAHWDCLSLRGFMPNFQRCPIRDEDVGSGRVPVPYCWEPVPAQERADWIKLQKQYHPNAKTGLE
jgi:hypothetical protein